MKRDIKGARMDMKRALFSSREEKMMSTKGYLSGRITLKQYELLLRLGYDGGEIMKWTKAKAFKEISRSIATPLRSVASSACGE
jgi:hypothetical protein